MSSKFVHLHVHTEYSLLDGACRIPELIEEAVRMEMPAVAITDHGNMYGVVDFYLAAKKKGIKPILGCEVYTVSGSRFDRGQGAGREWDFGHLVLLAKNAQGYKNLMKIVSAGFIDGYYYRPRVDMEILQKYSEGIIASSACLSGDVPKLIMQGNLEAAEKCALKYRDIFGADNYYLELQNNGIDEQNVVNSALIKISANTGIPLICTNDVHYLKKEDAEVQDILLCIQTGKLVDDTDRMRFSTQEFYFKSPEQMEALFANVPQAVANTLKIAEQCNVELDLDNTYLPAFEVPDGEEHYAYLYRLCKEGIYKRYGEEPAPEVWARLEYELGVISSMGFVDYYLIVWDFIHYAKSNGIYVGPGRGSGAASIAAYALGITNLDPLKYDLIFERFLNPERVSMPDFDVDFCIERRHEVIEYVERKYGKEKVAQIISFGTMKAKAAIRDVGRVLALPYGDVDKISKMIPNDLKITIDKAMTQNPDLKAEYEQSPEVKKLIDVSRRLEGIVRHASTHAAGVVIGKDILTDYVPLQKNGDTVTTQFPMEILARTGLVKMDFLGLRTLTVIRDALDLIKKNTGKVISMTDLPLDDGAVYKMISDGRTVGVFQLESPGMTQFMKDLCPTNFEDIIAGIALYRPGPMDQIPRYIANKKNPENVTYEHPLLEPILNVTYGCMIYQEQVMRIFRELAGFSLGQSDIIRRAMSKKKMDVMMREKENFIHGTTDENGKVLVPGAVRNGVPLAVAEHIYEEITAFASYAFNKAHAACYAVVSYYTGWLKRYYPVEFMAATINSFLSNSGRVAFYVKECEEAKIKILPPDINKSESRFSTDRGNIRIGLAAIKGVGEGPAEAIISERANGGEYKTFTDFVTRLGNSPVNKRCVESFIKCGVFDSFGVSRAQLMNSYEIIMDSAYSSQRRNVTGQISLFGDDDEQEEVGEVWTDVNEYEKSEILAMEKEALGIYISGHPLNEYTDIIEKTATFNSLNVEQEDENIGDSENTVAKTEFSDGSEVISCGIISAIKTKITKSGEMMAFVTLEDFYGSFEVLVFPKVLSAYKDIIFTGSIVFIKGRLSIREDEETKLICMAAEAASEVKKNGGLAQGRGERRYDQARAISRLSKGQGTAGRSAGGQYAESENIGSQSEKSPNRQTKLYIKIDGDFDEHTRQVLQATLSYCTGPVPVILCINGLSMQAERKFWVSSEPFAIEILKEKYGDKNVLLKEGGNSHE